jgi:tryptophan synthase alpha chain
MATFIKNPQIIGFGISDAETFSAATTYANGAIIGSAFIKMLTKDGSTGISKFVKTIR